MRRLKGQQGFTLIEIISVLVILGILAAVAVPKYYDMQEEARQKAAAAFIAEVQARLNLSFGQNLLKNSYTEGEGTATTTTGGGCAAARKAAITEAFTGIDNGEGYNGWSVTDPASLSDSSFKTGTGKDEKIAASVDIKKVKDPSLVEVTLASALSISAPICN